MKITLINENKRKHTIRFPLFMLKLLKKSQEIKDADIDFDLLIKKLKKFKKTHKDFVILEAKSSDGEEVIITL